MDTAQYAAEVLGGACGAVAECLMTSTVVLPSEAAAASGLPEHTVRCVLEILTRYGFADRDGIGYVSRKLPGALVKRYEELKFK